MSEPAHRSDGLSGPAPRRVSGSYRSHGGVTSPVPAKVSYRKVITITVSGTNPNAETTTEKPTETTTQEASIKVPYVIGRIQSEAQSEITGLGLGYHEIGDYSDSVPAGNVISHETIIKVEESTKYASDYTLLVSLGNPTYVDHARYNQTLAFATQSAFERNAQNSPDYFIN